MKRLSFVVLFFLCAWGINAQNWVVTNENTDGDSYTCYEYVNKAGIVIFYEGDLSLLLFNRFDGLLADERSTIFGLGKKGFSVKAVLFDNYENVLASYDLWLWKLDGLKAGGEIRSRKGTVKRILRHLKERKGKALLVFPKSDFTFLIDKLPKDNREIIGR